MTPSEHAMPPEEVMAYLDGELPPARARELLAHVAGCDECRQLADDLRGISRRMTAWNVDDVPAGLHVPRVNGTAPVVAVTTALWRRRSVWGFAAVAATVVILATTGTFSRAKRVPAQTRAVSISQPSVSTGAGGTAAPAMPEAAATDQFAAAQAGPVIARSARLRVLAGDLNTARSALERIVRDAKGFVGDISAGGGQGSRWLRATLRVPAESLDSVLVTLRQTGQVLEESQTSEDVTEQSMDIDVRLANGRRTEQRLVELLGARTGKLSDVLDVERELARVRTEVERLEAQRKALDSRVVHATIVVEVSEEPRASVTLGPTAFTTRLRNAVVDGARTALGSVVEVLLFVVQVAPAILLWALLLAWPVAVLVRRRRRHQRPAL